MNFKLKEIIDKIAEKNFLTHDQVKRILDSEFKCAKEVMKEGIIILMDDLYKTGIMNGTRRRSSDRM